MTAAVQAAWFYQLMKSQFFTTIPKPTQSFSNQTVIVTGSNTGLGLEAARHLLALDATKVILAVRTPAKGEAAAQDLISSCNVPASRVEVWQLDMSNHGSIKAFAKRASGLDRLDAAILNAGVFSQQWYDVDGVERHIAINVISTILLELLLLPTLQRSAKHTGLRGRLTIVGSETQHIADPRALETSGRILDKLNTKGEIQLGTYYPLSKLLVYYVHRSVTSQRPVSKDSNVIATVMTPGACTSDLFRGDDNTFGMRVAMKAIARTTEVGGRALVLAVNPDLGIEYHGKFLMDGKIGL
jgi:NAD(P)-dependent dehydrogenase (short-subunit alcohol dehydrogenase family)